MAMINLKTLLKEELRIKLSGQWDKHCFMKKKKQNKKKRLKK